MLAYAKKALLAQKATNCLSDIMFEEALAIPSVANWGPGLDSDTSINDSTRERSLLGVPVSIKGGSGWFKATKKNFHQLWLEQIQSILRVMILRSAIPATLDIPSPRPLLSCAFFKTRVR
jgi:hypothetical protein